MHLRDGSFYSDSVPFVLVSRLEEKGDTAADLDHLNRGSLWSVAALSGRTVPFPSAGANQLRLKMTIAYTKFNGISSHQSFVPEGW